LLSSKRKKQIEYRQSVYYWAQRTERTRASGADSRCSIHSIRRVIYLFSNMRFGMWRERKARHDTEIVLTDDIRALE
jgi:hypothetical protein